MGDDVVTVRATDRDNRSTTYRLTVTVNGPLDLTPDTDDQLTGQDADGAWSLEAGETRTFLASCAPTTFALDGHVLVQSVDQGTGQPADVDVLRARLVGQNSYEFRLRNTASGRAQGHFALSCVSRRSFKGHTLDLTSGYGGSIQFSGDDDAPTKSLTLRCAIGQVPVSPSFMILGDAPARLIQSEPTPDGRGWRFTAASTVAARINVEFRCLTYTDLGRQVMLRAYRTSTSQTFAGGDTTRRDTSLDCGVGFLGLVGGYSTSTDLPSLGQESQAGRRLFWVQNLSEEERSATFSLLCVALVTDTTTSPIIAPGTYGQPTPTPTPTVSVSPTGRSASLASRSLRSGGAGSVTATLRCSAGASCSGTLTLTTSAGTPIGSARYSVRAGRSAKVRVQLNRAGRRFVRRASGRPLAARAVIQGSAPITVTLRG